IEEHQAPWNKFSRCFFLQRNIEYLCEFENHKVTEHLEDIHGFLAKKKLENLRKLECAVQ
ncbi:MAG: hypothetical protein WC186_01485, partial [Bacteroidales bacterium]